MYLLVGNLETFGGTGAFGHNIPTIAAAIIIIGFIWGLVLRFVAPATYAKIGRMVFTESD